MTMRGYVVEPTTSGGMPTGVTYAQARAIREATSTSRYSDGTYDYLIVVTRLATVTEDDEGFFLDSNWVDFVFYEYPGWSFIHGTGANDPGGEWLAQWQRLDNDDPGIWVLLGRRQHVDLEV
jgi:hypothetical protein